MRSWRELPRESRAWIVAGAICAILFAAIAADVRYHGALEQRDQPVADWLAARAGSLALFSRGFDLLGSILVMAPLVLLGAGVLWWRGQRREAAGVVILSGIAVVSYSLLKLWFARPRPLTAVGIETGYSFPSGHATFAAVLAVYLAWLGARWARGKRLATIFIGAATAWALLMAFSRMTYGVHYMTDVLGGLALGAAIGALGIGLPALIRR